MGPFSYQFSEAQGEVFLLIPGIKRFFLGSCWGDYEESFLRLQGDYNLNEGNWEELTAGIGLGNEDFPWEWKERS